MLVLPDDFEPGLVRSPVTREAGWWFVFGGSELLVRSDGAEAELPLAVDWPFAGWPMMRRLYLGTLRGRPCHAVEVAEVPPPPGITPRLTSGRPTWTRASSRAMRWWQARASS